MRGIIRFRRAPFADVESLALVGGMAAPLVVIGAPPELFLSNDLGLSFTILGRNKHPWIVCRDDVASPCDWFWLLKVEVSAPPLLDVSFEFSC